MPGSRQTRHYPGQRWLADCTHKYRSGTNQSESCNTLCYRRAEGQTNLVPMLATRAAHNNREQRTCSSGRCPAPAPCHTNRLTHMPSSHGAAAGRQGPCAEGVNNRKDVMMPQVMAASCMVSDATRPAASWQCLLCSQSASATVEHYTPTHTLLNTARTPVRKAGRTTRHIYDSCAHPSPAVSASGSAHVMHATESNQQSTS